MIKALVLVILFWPVTALADWPAMYEVTGVAADDVLNIRAEPSVKAEIIGSLAPAAQIEITGESSNGTWGRINNGEGIGWVALRFLVQADGAPWPPETLACYGTEPFWSLSLNPQATRFEMMDETAIILARTSWLTSRNHIGRSSWIGTDLDENSLTLVLQRRECSDGMSDRIFGLTADIVLSGPAAAHYTGCCSLFP